MEDRSLCLAYLEDKVDILFVGSCMIDFLMFLPKLPAEGQNVQGFEFKQYFGGKGANQCVAAAKLNAPVGLIAKLGDDPLGINYLNKLNHYESINTKYVRLLESIPTGVTCNLISSAITEGNQSIVVPGSNAYLCPNDVEAAANMFLQAKVIVFQGETPWETTLYCLNKLLVSPDAIAKTIINVSPAISSLNPLVLTLADFIIVNEIEAGILTNMTINTEEDLEVCVEKLLNMNSNNVIVTMGGSGVVYATKDSRTLKTVRVDRIDEPVDIRGVGDCFVGAFSYYLCYFPALPLGEIIYRAAQIARLSLLESDVQDSFPTKEMIENRLFFKTCYFTAINE